ncbi:MAG TPA: sodium:solute symporter family protein, partial [Blastocatellia bacterium]
MNILLTVLVAYSLLMIALGAVVSRGVRESNDFYVAGRGLGASYLAVTLIAANIGAGSTVGAAGLGYRDGLSAWWWVGSAGIGSLILALSVGPKIWTVAKEKNLLTVGDYLEHRFDRRVRLTAALFLWLGSLVILSGQLIAVAWILNVVAGVSKTVGCLLAAIVCTIYFTAGGLHSTVRVNLLQLCVKFIGFLFALAFAIHLSGGIGGLGEKLGAKVEGDNVDSYLSFFGAGGAAIARYMAALVPSFIISPGLLQKIFGARDTKSVRIGVGINAVVLLLFAIVPVAIGMIARGWLEPLGNRELAMPLVLSEVLPLWLGALLLAAIFSAEVSTADAVLFMLTTSLGKDFYKGILKPEATDRELLRFTRRAAVICGVGSALLALALETVIGALTVFYSIITAVFLLPMVFGLYSKRASARSVLISIGVTVGMLFLIELAPRVSAIGPLASALTYPVRVWGVPSLVVAIAAGLAAILIAVAFEKEPKQLAAAREGTG